MNKSQDSIPVTIDDLYKISERVNLPIVIFKTPEKIYYDVYPEILEEQFSEETSTIPAEQTFPSKDFSISSTSSKDFLIPDLSNFITNKFVVPDVSEVAGEEEKTLGGGNYGRVYKTTKNLAIKEFNGTIFEVELMDTSTLKEIAILKYLKHPNIINVFALQIPSLLVMSIASGTLENYKFTNIQHRKFIFYQIFSGLNEMHSKGIWHLDIKPENILIFEENKIGKGYVTVAKIADFGLSLYHPIIGQNSENVVTLYWKSPELLLGDDYFTELVDIWSTGIMLLEQILDFNIMIVTSYIDAEFKIFKLLGTPTEDIWPGVTTLSGWSNKFPVYERSLEKLFNIIPSIEDKFSSLVTGDEFSSLVTAGITEDDKSTKRQRVNITEDEYQILLHCLTWPNLRYSARKILSLNYWDSIREEIAIRIPTKESNVNVLQTYMKEQRQPIRQKWYQNKNRKMYYGMIWKMKKDFPVKPRTIFYAFTLMDFFVEKRTENFYDILVYCYTMFKIAADLFQEFPPNHYSYMKYFEDNQYYRNMIKAEKIILTEMDFDILYITPVDFVDEYLKKEHIAIERKVYPERDIVDNLKVSEEEYNKIIYYLYLLTLNYKFVVSYTPAQLAQIAIRAVVDHVEEIMKLPNLYTNEIEKYLYDFIPSKYSEQEEEHSKYFPKK